MTKNNSEFLELIETINFLSHKGWVPATSSNFSISTDPDRFLVSVSGVDKSKMTASDFMIVDESLNDIENTGKKPSAESLIHLEIYSKTSARCVLHTHSLSSTVLTMKRHNETTLSFLGYELVKALPGKRSHEEELCLPIFENSQDMIAFSKSLGDTLQSKRDLAGFLIRGHGLYAWGDSVSSAKRHIEALEFLMNCRLMEWQIQ